MSEQPKGYPLSWPAGRPRTASPRRSYFSTPLGEARDALYQEIVRLNGSNPVITTNLPLKKDGDFYTKTRRPDDCGVAVYFEYEGRTQCFACDVWDHVADNVQAIRKTIEALRGIGRWGSTEMMERAFAGFQGLPSPDKAGGRAWHQVLDCDPDVGPDELVDVYRRAAARTHPDREGGDRLAFERVQVAYEQARSRVRCQSDSST